MQHWFQFTVCEASPEVKKVGVVLLVMHESGG